MTYLTLSSRKKLLNDAEFEIRKIRNFIKEQNQKSSVENFTLKEDDKNFLNNITKYKSFNDLFVSEQSIKEFELIRQEYQLADNVAYFFDELPNSIKKSKFAKMSVSDISEYAKKNESNRKEIQQFMKLVYDWAFTKNDEQSTFAKLYKKNFKKRLEQGYTEQEIYDWYHNNQDQANTYVFLSVMVAVAKFILLLSWAIN